MSTQQSTERAADLHAESEARGKSVVTLTNMLRTCSEALTLVTAERDKLKNQALIDQIAYSNRVAERDKLSAELDSLRDSGVELPKPVAWRFERPGISKLDVWPHGGAWERLHTESQLRDYGDRRAMAERERAARVSMACAEAIRKGETK